MRVLILWADGKSGNYGVRVLAEGMAALARQAWGDDVVVNFQDYGRGDSSVSFGLRAIAEDLRSRNGPIKTKVRQYDAVIDSGAGDSFADIYGFKRLFTMVYGQRAVVRQGVPLLLGPQTIGPFNTRIGRTVARRTLKSAAVVLTRDSVSQAYATELGRTPDLLTTDVVFALPRPDKTQLHDVLLNVSGLLWFPNPHVDHDLYRKAVVGLVKDLRDRGREVALLAHVINPVSTVDDRAAILELTELVPGIQVALPESLTAARETIGGANLVIAARMHASLNALSLGVPTIPWAYSRKFAPLLADIGWKYSVDLRTEPEVAERTLATIEAMEGDGIGSILSAVRQAADERLAQAATALREAVR
ncbi:polysaccharide pyruvyl transferase family protein [Curtobacterium sp. MCPF17_050]|uniref:polysaccharide pyruvyl transferase family protein n=1 Tax=Curtobacterium sp. MCPF17_050 TaxID=2175664 RepID=UPI000D994B6F|nr:polysaccharide pyruvyl transferase family protein [Curtobacterium sp. MCPF17_050]WIB16062.1 polysaccharide pyruvyl transferase family protein [Curtobacterium sp. MCPF17_050]